MNIILIDMINSYALFSISPQSYYEEMLDRSPRRKLFNDYAKQLMRRYPNMRDEITVRLTHLNNQWERLQSTVAPSDGLRDRETMLRGKLRMGIMIRVTI